LLIPFLQQKAEEATQNIDLITENTTTKPKTRVIFLKKYPSSSPSEVWNPFIFGRLKNLVI